MNSKYTQIIGLILAILILLFSFLMVYKGGVFLARNFERIDTNILATVIAGLVTIIGYYITRYFEKKKEIERQIREQKLPTYQEFINFIFKVFETASNDAKLNSEDLQKDFWSMNKKSTLWLSDRSLKAYVKWKKLSAEYSKMHKHSTLESLEVLVLLEDLLFEIRRDIGHKNKDLKRGDILKLFVTDLNEYQIG
ncbi:hypothetical protein [Roseivirga sp. UBA838]|uniref:hypothetical protein n=1 Tax=Roseivirga sp. UBA838 TaxID=1947393 RepID=UPI00257B6E1D|nr:hypothetical protein [Roseivirga sp. UBA838]|tara:strand:- start:2617 stop:3201 length:585 start_codon:yes stop_codon:yes gene_type:complete